jgi:hypothetical protein
MKDAVDATDKSINGIKKDMIDTSETARKDLIEVIKELYENEKEYKEKDLLKTTYSVSESEWNAYTEKRKSDLTSEIALINQKLAVD